MSAQHEWLNLLEVSGPFVAVPVLREVFPQGLEELQASRATRLRSAYEEWRDAVDAEDSDLERLHAAWIDEVLRTALDADDQLLKSGEAIPASATAALPEHDTTIAPERVIVDPAHGEDVLVPIHVFSPDTDLSASMKFGGLTCSPGDRMALHLRALKKPVGLVTNGERWMLVYAPAGHVATFASWYARIWGQEPTTLRAFASLLGVRRLFEREQDRLPGLFERSLKHQDEVTDALGDQVRRAVEVLVQALDRADQDRNRELLRDVTPQELYEAGLTVMMRLVFLLAAEERGLLLLGEPRYDSFYAVSTLRMQLRAESDEILERRRAAWSRLLAVSRAVFGGIDHPTLRLPAMGGSLFDPDRFPFLEGRLKGTSWRQHRAEPLPIDDRTVLLLLEAIQTFEGRTLSYRALDVEQIGHVYEGLLERTVSRVDDVTLELERSAQAKDARITLGELESARLDGQATVVRLLVERSHRSESAIENALAAEVETRQGVRLLSACRGDVQLRDRLEPYVRLLRTDPWGYPLVHPKGAFVVVLGADRRETGTHYTPKSLTECIVEETLTPLVYEGPARGSPRAEWKLKSPSQILDLKVCDPAMGSGAFLVQACRFLSGRLVDAWAAEEAAGRVLDPAGLAEGPRASFVGMPAGVDARAENARRIVAERCLYGIDLNPLAVELAKLSLWLVTLSKGRPFGFLDHNLRCGDSLLGIHRLDQLTQVSMSPKQQAQGRLFGRAVRQAVDEALAIRVQLRETPIRDIRDVESMTLLDAVARDKLRLSKELAGAFIATVFAGEGDRHIRLRLADFEVEADDVSKGDEESLRALSRRAASDLAIDDPSIAPRTPFHWPLEFPEVFQRSAPGFDAIVGNPPFLGGRHIKNTLGTHFFRWLDNLRGNEKGSPDLVVYFLLRAASLLSKAGMLGLITTSGVRDTGNRVVGLDRLLKNGFAIVFAISKMQWPGAASVEVSLVVLRHGEWSGRCLLDGRYVTNVSAALSCENAMAPHELKSLKPFRSDGFTLMGEGFLLSIADKNALLERYPTLSEFLFPFFGGEDLADLPSLATCRRWAVDFGDREVALVEQFPEVLRRLKETVEPFRESQKGQIHQECFWKYWDMRPRLREYQASGKTYLVCPSTAKYVFFRRHSGRAVFRHKVKVFFFNDIGHFAVMQSNLHEAWVRATAGTRNSSIIEYNSSRSFGTFPFCAVDDERLATIGSRYMQVRDMYLQLAQIGPTELYNRVHKRSAPSEASVEEMRELSRDLDRAVLCAYGWDDINLGHDFHEQPNLTGNDRVRFTISATARSEVIRRLAELNRQRYEQEQASASVANPRSVGRVTAKPSSPNQGVLGFVEEAGVEAKAKASAAAKKVRTRRPR